MTTFESLSSEQYDELGSAVRGQVYLRGDPGFVDFTVMFNGNVVTSAKAVVCPLDAEDVSKIVLFCLKHSLSPSAKAGGYGTAGWAIGGDIIIDLCKLVDVDVEPPLENGSFTSLRDITALNSKGKKLQSLSVSPRNAAKRRREDDANLREYSSASKSVASFLGGPGLPTTSHSGTNPDDPSPNVRRKLDDATPSSSSSIVSLTEGAIAGARDLESPYVEVPSRQISCSSSASAASSDESLNSTTHPTSTRATTPAVSPKIHAPSTTMLPRPAPIPEPSSPDGVPPAAITSPTSAFSSRNAQALSLPPTTASPFGYLDTPDNFPPAPPIPTLHSSFAQQPSSQVSYPLSTISGSRDAPILPGASSSTPTSVFVSSAEVQRPPYGHSTIPIPAQAEAIHPHAFVTFGAGMRQKEIDTFTAKHKLEARYLTGSGDGIPYHVPFAAHPVGSSIMLLGGFGFLSRLHGLSIDNLVEVEMVLADGRIVIINENEYPDLWWALRGAGPCFGIATRYKAKAFPIPVVFAGNLIYRFNKATAPSLIKHFRDCVKGAPRELYANVLLTAGPAGKDSLVVVQMCYIGSKEQGQEYLQAISSWDGEKCLLNEVDEKSFLHQQDSVAQVLRGKAGRQWFIRSALISSLPDDIINQTVIQFAGTPVGCTWLFELAGGAIAEFDDTCVPKAQREATFTIAALHQWEIDVDDDRCVDSAEEWIAGTLKPVHLGGPLPSFLGRHEPPDRTKACFGRNWPRLCEIKEAYDPKNLFKNTFWPLDASGVDVEPHTHEPPTPSFLSTSVRGQKKKVFT